MTKKEIETKKNKINHLIDSQRLHDAFKELRSLSRDLMTWEITDDIDRKEEGYRYMLKYAVSGVQDPGRQDMYRSLQESLRLLLDQLTRRAMRDETPTLYFSNVRTSKLNSLASIGELLRQYTDVSDKVGLADAAGGNGQLIKDREKIETLLFNTIWITMPLTGADNEALAKAINDRGMGRDVKQLIISALLLGELNFHDPRRLNLLAEAYLTDDAQIAPVAMIALLIALYMSRDRYVDNSLVSRLKIMADNPHWAPDLRDAFLELVRARDTERITRKMNEELVPQIMKLRPEIARKLGMQGRQDAALDIDENPEWQELLDKSGISDKMKELFEIQLEGGDVFMSTFSHLKGFPFFNEIANWFQPFNATRSEVAALPAELQDLAMLLEGTPVFCNSDKFSFTLSLSSLGEAQRRMMREQMNSQIDALMEMQHADNDGPVSDARRRIMNRYVQDLYRFFKLFRRRDEFVDPFETDLNLVKIPAISGELNDRESLRLIAEFYFKHRYWQDALGLYKVVESLSVPDVSLYQKMGFALERLGKMEEALKYYRQAELLDGESLWTLKHISRTAQATGDAQLALKYWERVDELTENDREKAKIALAEADCYMILEDFKNSIALYHKALYLDTTLTTARRPLAWSLMMSGEREKAHEIFSLILNDHPTPDDYLNLGHLSLVEGDSENALNYYALSITGGDGSIESFAEKMYADTRDLALMGLSEDVIPLVIDAVNYSISRGGSSDRV